MTRLCIVCYGVGNVGSIVNAFRKIGNVDIVLVKNDQELRQCDYVILPGVGSFDSAIRYIRENIPELKQIIQEKPTLGICLGMQVLFEKSEEGVEQGLSIYPGKVTRLKSRVVPHIGWNSVEIIRECELVRNIPSGSYFYFAHSFCLEIENCANRDIIVGKTTFENSTFASILADEHRQIYGTQFHPERSSKVGLKLLENFLKVGRK